MMSQLVRALSLTFSFSRTPLLSLSSAVHTFVMQIAYTHAHTRQANTPNTSKHVPVPFCVSVCGGTGKVCGRMPDTSDGRTHTSLQHTHINSNTACNREEETGKCRAHVRMRGGHMRTKPPRPSHLEYTDTNRGRQMKRASGIMCKLFARPARWLPIWHAVG